MAKSSYFSLKKVGIGSLLHYLRLELNQLLLIFYMNLS